MQHYPLATSYFGVDHAVVLPRPILSTCLSLEGIDAGPVDLPATLEADALSGGWRVRTEHGVLGVISAEEAAEFPELSRLRASALVPETMVTIEIVEDTLEVAVALGIAPWMVSCTDQPPGSILLRGGAGVLIDTTTGDLPPDAPTASFISILELQGGDIVARIEEHPLGTVAPAIALPHLRDILEHAAAQGATISTWTFAAGQRVAVDIPLPTEADPFTDPLPVVTQPARPLFAPLVDAPLDLELPATTFSAYLPSGTRRPHGPLAHTP